MKQVTIVGIGMGRDTITAEGLQAVQNADALIGAPRLTAEFEDLRKPSFSEYTPEKVAGIIKRHYKKNCCVLVSGDVGFYSAAHLIAAKLTDYHVKFIPGVSSMSRFFAELGRPWHCAAAVNCHGREANIVDNVRRNKLTFILTGGNTADIAKLLIQAGFGGLAAYAGENLALPDERIISSSVSELLNLNIGNLAVLLIENPDYDSRVRFGISDAEFIRNDVLMTKAEVRAVTMSKLSVAPDSLCWDVGCGTGSVTVEMALAAYNGHVYAVDKNESAIVLTKQNCREFHIGGVSALQGAAPKALEELPAPDIVFIGGSSGKTGGIFDVALSKNPMAKIVVSAVTLETLQSAKAAFEQHGVTPEIVQISVAHTRPAGSAHMPQGHSPVFILSGARYG